MIYSGLTINDFFTLLALRIALLRQLAFTPLGLELIFSYLLDRQRVICRHYPLTQLSLKCDL